MKWLAAFLCMLAMPALAESLPQGTIQLPTSMVCGPFNKELKSVYEQYGEFAFLQGKADVFSPDWTQTYQGDVRMFLNPDNGSFTLFLDIKQELTCMIVTGKGMQPIIRGDSL